MILPEHERTTIPSYYRSPAWTSLRQRVVARDGEVCFYCGLRGFQADHVIPRGHGGPASMNNLVCCCDRCNALVGSAFFISPAEKQRWVRGQLDGTPYRSGHIIAHPDIPHKFNGMSPDEYRAYLEARKHRRTLTRVEGCERGS